MSFPRFIRKYRVLVMDGNNVALDVSDLRCTFRIEKGFRAINYGEISIYNLSGQTQSDIISFGMRVVLEAGYENGQYGVVFDGDILQPLWDRKNVVDDKLTLHCLDGDSILNYNFIGMTVKASHDARSNLLAIMSNARNKIVNSEISEDLDTTKMPRGKVFFGLPKTYFREIANANNHQWTYVDRKLIFVNLTNIGETKALLVSPETGLIGTPQQTQDGVEFKVLLNPNIKIQLPYFQVKIDNSAIRQQKIIYGQNQTRLDQDGYYYIGSVVHCGDTRGEDWYTECIGYNGTGGQLAAMAENVKQNFN